MSFTYDIENPNDITRVRFHLSDTVEQSALWTDEEISFAIELQSGVWQRAVISLMEQYITTLARTPKFNADWLSVDSTSSLKTWNNLLIEKRREFGLNAIVSRAKHTYRADSLQSTEPDYTEDKDGLI